MAGNQSSSIYSSHHNVILQRERKVIPGTPPGFHFTPTDEELIEHYVRPYNFSRGKSNHVRPYNYSPGAKLPLPNGITIPEADVYRSHPTELPSDFQYGIGNEFYCFAQWKPKDRGGSRIDRQVGVGVGVAPVFWKTNEGESEIWKTNERESEISCTGFKKTFSFSEVKPEGKGTRWIVDEFSEHSSSRKNGKPEFDHYVLCRIKPPNSHNFIEEETVTTSNSNEVTRGNEDIFEDLMPLEDPKQYSPSQWPGEDIHGDFISFKNQLDYSSLIYQSNMYWGNYDHVLSIISSDNQTCFGDFNEITMDVEDYLSN